MVDRTARGTYKTTHTEDALHHTRQSVQRETNRAGRGLTQSYMAHRETTRTGRGLTQSYCAQRKTTQTGRGLMQKYLAQRETTCTGRIWTPPIDANCFQKLKDVVNVLVK